jgi:hypothetical protein
MGNSAADSLNSWVDGSKTAKEAFDDFSKSVVRDLIRIAIQAAITKAIGGGSAGGGGFGAVFEGIFGNRAVGGRIYPGRTFEVAEQGRPELIQQGNRSFVVGGPQGGNVTPITKNSTSNVSNLTVILPPQTTPRTTMQTGEDVARTQKRYVARNQ